MPASSPAAAASDAGAGAGAGVPEWELGLPSGADLTPLSFSLVPPNLAAAFSIPPEPHRTSLDVLRASQSTLALLRRHSSPPSALKPFLDDPADDPAPRRRSDPTADDAPDNSSDDPSNRTLKRPRLVWTPQLHKRFVDVVAHLGIKSAVPKTIMQLMNVEGLTRENVASHLQKYRLYLKRMQGLSDDGPSSSDQLFASTPVPQSLHEPAAGPYAVPGMIPMPMPVPVFSMGHGSPVGFEHNHHPYGGPKDWSGGSNYRSIVSYPRVSGNDK